MFDSIKNYMRFRTRSNQSDSNSSTGWRYGKTNVVAGDSSTKSLYHVSKDAIILTSVNGRQLTDVERDAMVPKKIMVDTTMISTSQGKS